ncbi:hypothetical protein [Streptomyces sp. NPDC057966]|uniref:hypothetical protein n=1 Tax=Streptomyces sp. NPDC057966 TaxID=3346292 RepID=UPI0036EE4DB4
MAPSWAKNGPHSERGRILNPSGAGAYLHAWKPGVLGLISWIDTGLRLTDPDVHKSFASPESGDSVRKSASSSVIVTAPPAPASAGQGAL